MESQSTNPPLAALAPEVAAISTRLEVLNETTLTGVIISGICIVVNFQAFGASTAINSYPFWFNVLLCAAFGLLAWRRRLAFRLRAGLLVAALLGAAVGAFQIFGMDGAGVAFLIAAAVMAAILLGFRTSAAVSALALAGGAGFTYLFLATAATPLLAKVVLNPWATWASIGGNLVLAFTMLVVSQRRLWESQGFVAAISKQRRELVDTRAALQKQTRQLEMASAELAGVNIQLQEQSRTLERRAQQLAAAAEIGRAATSTFDLPALLSTSVNLIRDRFGFYHASVFIVEPGSQVAELRESTGEAGRELKARRHSLAVGSRSLIGMATSTRHPIIVQDVLADPNYFSNPLLPDTRAEAVLPMLSGDQIVGAVDVQSNQSNVFTDSDLAILSAITDQLSVAVQNARLYAETEQAVSENAALFKISAELAAANSPQDLVDVVAHSALPTAATSVSLLTIHPDLNGQPLEVEVRAFYDAEGKLQRAGLRLPAASLPLLAQLNGSPFVVSDINIDPRVDTVTRETLAKLEIASACLLPLRAGRQRTGALLVASNRPAQFTALEIDRLRLTTDQIVVAMEKFRLLEEARHRADQSTAATEIGRAATSTFDLPALLETTVNLIRDRFEYYHVSVFIVEPGSEIAELRESTGEAGRLLKERKHQLAIGSKSLVGTATSRLQPVIVQDVTANPNYYANPLLPDTRAEAVLPMLSGEQVIGAVDVQSTTAGAFKESEISILSTIVGQLAVAIQNARLYAETQARLGEIATLNELSRAFSSTLDLDKVYQIVRERVPAVMNTRDITLALYDEAQNQITFAFAIERGQPLQLEPRAPVGLTGHIVRNKQPVLLQGTLDEVNRQTAVLGGIFTEDDSLSYFGVPLLAGRQVVGAMAVESYERLNAFDENHQRLFTTIADQLAVAIQNARLYAETQAHLAEIATLNELSRAFSSTLDLEQVYRLVRERLASVLGTGDLYLALYDEAHDLMSFAFIIERGQELHLAPRSPEGVTGHIIRTKEPLSIQGSLDEVRQRVETLSGIVTESGMQASYFATPLMVGRRVIGVLAAQDFQRFNAFDSNKQRLMTTIGGQLAVALQNARLFAQTQAALAENASLFQVSRALSEVDSPQGILEVIAAHAMPRSAAHTGLFWLHYTDEGRLSEVEVRAHLDITGEHEEHLGLRFPAAAWPLFQRLTPEPMVIANIDTQSQLDPITRETLRRRKMVSTCLIPIFTGGRLTAVITTSASRPAEFQPQEISVLRGVADLLAVTLQKLQLLDETRRRAEQLAATAEIGRASTASFDLSSVLATSVNLIRDRFGFYHASIFIIDPGSDVAELRESTGEAGRQLKARRHRLTVGSKSLVGAATASRRPVVVQDVRADPNYYPNPLLPETRAEAVIPLIAGDTVVGALDVQSTLRGVFTPGDMSILATIAGQLAVAVQNARLYDQTARWANRERLANQITTKIRQASAGDIDGMLRTAVTELRQALGASHGAVQLRPAAPADVHPPAGERANQNPPASQPEAKGQP